MTRVAIIGNAGGGKSTLVVALGAHLGLPVHHFDKLQYQPGWKLTPAEELAASHAAILNEPTWVIDGWGSWPLIEQRFAHADAIVLVDFSLVRHIWWGVEAAGHVPLPPDI